METTAQLERQLRRDMEMELNRLQTILDGVQYNSVHQAFIYEKSWSRVEALKDRSRELDKVHLD